MSRLPRALSLTGLLTAAATSLAVLAPAGAAQAAPWPGHPGRSLVSYVVRPGDTATGLSVRYHAWTREFVALNGARLHVGERIRIPVVLAAARRARKAARKSAPAAAPARTRPAPAAATPAGRRGWVQADLSRDQVRRLVVATARRLGVPPQLALAIAWQESGWQQRRVSSTGALGVMQVMPDTGRWMRWYVGRRLHLRDTRDNVLAGVMTIKVLRANTARDRHAIAAYYQGLGAVRQHGLFADTRAYVAAVRAHQARIQRTGSPV